MPINTKIHSGGLADNAISTDKIAGDAVTSAKVADDAVGIEHLSDASGAGDKYHKVPVYADDAARNSAIGSPAVGMLIYNTGKGVVQQYNAQGWASVDSPPTISSLDYPGSATALNVDGEFTDATCDYDDDPTITHDASTRIVAGMTVSGTRIPANATVSSVTSTTAFELSAATTGGAVTNGTLTFGTSSINIPAQNVVSYGKKFAVSAATPHYDPFNGFTSGNLAAVQALGITHDSPLIKLREQALTNEIFIGGGTAILTLTGSIGWKHYLFDSIIEGSYFKNNTIFS